GRTPFYVYDREAVTRRVQDLRARLPASIALHYAMKANPMPALVQHVAGIVDGIDVASAREMVIALNAGMDPTVLSFAGPGKSAMEIRQAVAAGVTLNIESVRELACACNAGESLGIAPRIAVRVNPDFELKAAGMQMSGASKQFGIDAELVPGVL